MKVKEELRELRQADLPKLAEQLEEARRELFNLRLRLATRQLTQHHEIRRVRKRIARILTVLSEKQREMVREGP
jgi:large subunit ribosomal protein L29